MADGNQRPDKDEILLRLKECLSARSEIVVAYLFGSVARDEGRADSDVDVAALIQPGYCEAFGGTYGYRADLLGDLSSCLNRNDVDLVILNDSPAVLSHRVLRDGKTILCRDEKTRIEFTEDVMREYFDTAHLRKIRAEYLERSIVEGTFGRPVSYRRAADREV